MREVTIKIGLERLDTQEGITVEALLDSGAMGLVMSSEFTKKKGFKLKKLERPMQVRNVDGSFNREGPIENTVEVNVYYKEHVERTEIDVIGGQKWEVILGMPWLARYNPEIDWKTGEVKMTRYPEEVREFVKEQLRKGYIRPSKSPQTAPVFFVGKKDGKRRMVQDYRYLNEWTIKNNYPLPLILDVLENIGTKKLFTKMDLRWGYNNVRIKEGDEWKAVFTMLEGSFEPTVMFFGLTNSPATFQAIMNELLRDLINTGKVAVFIDDVIVGTETEEGHDELVAEVVKRLEENDLYMKPEKCKWKVKEIEFLGVVIGPEGIKMEKEKVKGVLEWPTPKCVKDVQKFLGLANYYRRFIEGFATVARPLHDLVKKDKKMGVDGKGREDIQGIERAVYKGAGVGSSRYRQKNEDGSGCIRLCDGRSTVNGV